MSRPVPECHQTIAPDSRMMERDGERWIATDSGTARLTRACIGSRCSAFVRLHLPGVDPRRHLGICGLVSGAVDPWEDASAKAGEATDG